MFWRLGLGLRPLRCEDCDDPNADGDATPLGQPAPHDETVSCVSIFGSCRIYRMLDLAKEECPGHGPIQLLVASAVSVGFCVGPPLACLDARVQQFGWAHGAF